MKKITGHGFIFAAGVERKQDEKPDSPKPPESIDRGKVKGKEDRIVSIQNC